MENDVKVFENGELGLQVRTVLNPDGSISVSAEDTAIGFGWMQEKKGKIYPRWETLNSYCQDLGFSQLVGKDDYLPESLYYLLGMKANNERAQKYQRWLAMEVIPTLRKTGMYHVKKMSPEEMMRVQLGILDEQKERLITVEDKVDKLENTMNIDYSQQKQLRDLVADVARSALGGKEAKAYRYKDEDGNSIRAKVFSRIWHDFYDYFNINAYANLPRVRFKDALEYINHWQPPINMQLEIERINREDCQSFGSGCYRNY